MVKFVAFLLALVAVYYVNGAAVTPASKVPQNTIQQQIEGLLVEVQALTDNVSTSLKSALPDNKQVSDGLITHTQQFSQNVEGIIEKIQTEISNNKGNVDNLLKQSAVKLNDVLSSFHNLIGPENSAKVSEIKTQLDIGVKNATAEIQTFAKAVQPDLKHTGETLQNFAKGIVDDFVKAVDKLKTQVNALPAAH